MKIAVCVKHVPVGRLDIQPDSLRLDRSGPGELNDVDRNAIEEALGLQVAADDEIVIVSMGPEQATESLRTALALWTREPTAAVGVTSSQLRPPAGTAAATALAGAAIATTARSTAAKVESCALPSLSQAQSKSRSPRLPRSN